MHLTKPILNIVRIPYIPYRDILQMGMLNHIATEWFLQSENVMMDGAPTKSARMITNMMQADHPLLSVKTSLKTCQTCVNNPLLHVQGPFKGQKTMGDNCNGCWVTLIYC